MALKCIPTSSYFGSIKRFYFLSTILFFLSVSLIFSGCTKKESASGKPQIVEVDGVTVTEITFSEVPQLYETSGTIKAKTISQISSRIMGKVTRITFDEGDHVKEGEILVFLENNDLKARILSSEKAVEAARLNKELTEITYSRNNLLFEDKALSPQDIDQIKAKRDIARVEYEKSIAMLSESQIAYKFSEITAPFSGTVVEKKVEKGCMTVPGVPLLTIEKNNIFRLEAYIDESVSNKLKVGMEVYISINSIDFSTTAKIGIIVPTIDPATRTFLIKIPLYEKGLKTGLYGNLSIPIGKKQVLYVPKSAVIEKGQLTGLFVVDSNNMISYRIVKLGRQYGNNIEVISGLHSKEKVITEGVRNAVDGGVIKK